MPKQIPKDQLEAILAIVSAHSPGVQAATIHEGLDATLPPRMLQRRLALLMEQNRLIAEDRGRGRWYRLPDIAGEVRGTEEGNDTTVAVGEVYPPISPDGVAIKQAIRASIQSRRPVCYNRAFLETERLLELGESAEGKDALEAQMILNHKASNIARYRLRPSEYTAWRGIWK